MFWTILPLLPGLYKTINTMFTAEKDGEASGNDKHVIATGLLRPLFNKFGWKTNELDKIIGGVVALLNAVGLFESAKKENKEQKGGK